MIFLPREEGEISIEDALLLLVVLLASIGAILMLGHLLDIWWVGLHG